MHVEDRRTRMLLPVLGHADTKHVVPAPCMALLQRPRRGGGGRGGDGADAIVECERWACDTLGRCCSPSPEPALHRAGEVHPPASMLRCRLAPGGRGWAAAASRQQRSCAAAEIQQKAAVSCRHCQSAACRPSWLLKGRGTVAGLLGSHLIGAACPRAPRGALCLCREGCSDRGTLGSRLKEQK